MFNIQVVSAYAGIVPVNLVGNSCTTSTARRRDDDAAPRRSVRPSTFSGPYTIPPLKNCGLTTAALNLVIPGPGNTFTATATPQ